MSASAVVHILTVNCPRCHGSGDDCPETTDGDCWNCRGAGRVTVAEARHYALAQKRAREDYELRGPF